MAQFHIRKTMVVFETWCTMQPEKTHLESLSRGRRLSEEIGGIQPKQTDQILQMYGSPILRRQDG